MCLNGVISQDLDLNDHSSHTSSTQTCPREESRISCSPDLFHRFFSGRLVVLCLWGVKRVGIPKWTGKPWVFSAVGGKMAVGQKYVPKMEPKWVVKMKSPKKNTGLVHVSTRARASRLGYLFLTHSQMDREAVGFSAGVCVCVCVKIGI